MPIDRLYVARDDTATIISRRRIRVAGEGLTVSRWGGIEERVSAHQTLLPASSLTQASAVVLPPAVTAGALWALGVEPVMAFGAGAAVFLTGAYLWPLLRKLRPGKPRQQPQAQQAFCTLFDPPERWRFQEALLLAERITETWPAVAGLIDQRVAQRAVNQALWDLARVLTRHQEVRRIVASLETPHGPEVSPESTVGRALAEQRSRATALLGQLDAEIVARIAGIAATEAAGSEFVRDQRLLRTLRENARFLAAQQGEATEEDAGAELAERTRAVIEAYRELAPEDRIT